MEKDKHVYSSYAKFPDRKRHTYGENDQRNTVRACTCWALSKYMYMYYLEIVWVRYLTHS